MDCRTYGKLPFLSVAVHGGPGAPGGVSSLAKGLSTIVGTIEPFQSEWTVSGQVDELARQIKANTNNSVYVFGHSWGAWLSYLLAHSHPDLVRKAFLIGSGAFDAIYVKELEKRRLSHLTKTESEEYRLIIERLSNKNEGKKDIILTRLGALAAKADSYCVDPIPENQEDLLKIDGNQYDSVWSEGAKLRESGYFIKIACDIKVPIRVIHGADDPTPIEGVVNPIRAHLADFKWYEIAKCGHDPWKERYGKDEFWRIIKEELTIS